MKPLMNMRNALKVFTKQRSNTFIVYQEPAGV